MGIEASLPSVAVRERLIDNTIRGSKVIASTGGPLPDRARVVVVGGGIIGASVVFHLAELGVTDVVLMERRYLTSGTTWHPAGLYAMVRASHALTELSKHSARVYATLAERSGIDNAYNPRGCISVARCPERMTELKYAAALARHHGIEAETLSPREIAARHPLVDPGGLEGGVLFSDDGTVNPGSSALGLAKVAAEAGVRVLENVTVEGIDVVAGRAVGVRTTEGYLACDTVVVAGGLWTPRILQEVGVPIALHAAEHVWAITEPVEAPVWDLPFVRDLDGHIYIRGYRDRLLVGAFEPKGKPRPLATIPEPFYFGEFAPDLRHVEPSLERARERMPLLRKLAFERHLNAPESFTPDNLPIVGETPEVKGLFVAAGMNSQGIVLGPGVGRAVAEWIVAGGPTMDLAELAVGRFSGAQAGARYLRERTRESLGKLYSMHWPDLQPQTARGLRRTPLHERLSAAGAVFGEVAGWERANWYAEPGQRPEYGYSYGRPSYFDNIGREHRAAREAVALFDLSSFTKVEIAGPDALSIVQEAFAGNLDVAVGKVVYTPMLNERGGVEADLTVSRLATDRFFAVAPAVTQRAVRARFAGQRDVTSQYATLAVMGPRSRALLACLTDADLSSDAFPFATARHVDFGYGAVLAIRVSFAGELGWELYPQTEDAVALYDAIAEAGAKFDLRHAGYHALDTLRSEKGYRHWPHDVGPADLPIDVGLDFTVAYDKPSFTGRDAVLAGRQRTRRRRTVYIRLLDPQPLLRHGESVLHDGRVVGRVTSGAYGHHLGAAVGTVTLDEPELDVTAVTVDIAGRAVGAELRRRPFYDPDHVRLRA